MRWLSRALWVSPYYIGLCTTEEAFAREMKRLKVPVERRPRFMSNVHSAATTHFFEKTSIPMRYSAIVCMSPIHARGKSCPQIHALLVHEAVHIWQSVKENLGEHTPGRESEAYAIQHISQELMQAWAGRKSR